MKKVIAAVMLLCVLLCGTASAAGASIVEVVVTDTRLTAFVKGADKASSAEAVLGQYPSEGVTCQSLEDAGIAVKTLILVDNSISIPAGDRDRIKAELLELVAARKNNDYYAVGTISEDVTVTQPFTNDYASLKAAIEGIAHQDQETYITDALYDYLVLDPFARDKQDGFVRILLISDGVDNKSIGYTKDELLILLKGGNSLPLYTVGVENGKSGNPEEIENMFSLSRMTGAACCLFKDLGSSVSLTDMMAADWDNTAASMDIPETLQDGSLQTLTLTLGGTPVSVDNVRMPQSLKAPEDPAVPAPAPEPVIVEQNSPIMFVVIAVLATLLVIGIAAAVFFAVQNKKKKNDFQSLSEDEIRRKIEEENSATAFVGGSTEMSDDGTIGIWEDAKPRCMITLTDVHSPERRFQRPLEKSLVIGFSHDADICLNYDKSVSRKHCELIREEEDVYIINHSQSNGTTLNGNRVTAKMLVFDGCIIKMGRVEMRLEIN